MGLVLLVIGTVVVAVRCTTTVAEEKRRKTWEDLVLTSLNEDEIRRGKMWGILGATQPYLAIYALPMIVLGGLAGSWGILVAGCCLMVTGVVILLTGVFAMELQVSGESPDR